jgi:hypothetical protein
MIRRALKLRSRINIYVSEAVEKSDSPLPTAYVLSNDDWTVLQHLHDILKLFWKLTLRLEGQSAQGKHGAIWEVLPAMQVLINHLDDARKIHTPRKSKCLNACIVNALTKLCEYYKLLDSCPVYAASPVFNLAIKESHFERDWRGGPEGWTPTTREDIRRFWESKYKSKRLNTRHPNMSPPARLLTTPLMTPLMTPTMAPTTTPTTPPNPATMSRCLLTILLIRPIALK